MRLFTACSLSLGLALLMQVPSVSAESCWDALYSGVVIGIYDTPEQAMPVSAERVAADVVFRNSGIVCLYPGPNGSQLIEPAIGYTLGPWETGWGEDNWPDWDYLLTYAPGYIPVFYKALIIPYGAHGELCIDPQNPPIYLYASTHHRNNHCPASDVIKLSRSDGSSESDTVIDAVEPGKITANLVANVYDQNGQIVPNANVKLELSVDAESGGHHHPSGDRPKGTLSNGTMTGETITGNTDTNGLVFTFTAPATAGDHHITASCADGKTCKQEGPDMVWVGYKGLQSLGDNAVYRLIPNATKDPGHPDNHYLTLTAASRLSVFATLYHTRYPDFSVLQLNDASLERGGIFDLGHNWKAPHREHCRGTAIDIRANGGNGALNITSGTDPMIASFKHLAATVGADAHFEIPIDSTGTPRWDLRHFHTRLMGQEGLTCP